MAGADIDNDVGQAFFLPNLRTFIERFVQRNLRLLRALKSADDGAYQAEAAQTRLHLSQGAAMSVAQAPATGPRPDFANFIALVGELYRGVFEGGLAFWNDNRLVNFLRLTSEVRAINTRKEVMSMLAALATGTRSSERAFEFLGGSQYGSSAYTALNWNVLFQALQQYAQVLGSSTEKQSLPDQEVELVKGFLSVLTQVVRFNPTARNILSQWRNFDSLVILVLCAVPIGLKAALLEALGAFSVGKGENIAERVWTLIENNQVLQTFNIPINGIMNSGIVNDMEQAEAPAMTFPGTYAFVELLTILMETTGGVGPALDNLGSGRRKPGVWPYVDYVVDLVLLKLKNRGFSDPKERWKLEEACLRFVDVCLSTMNVNVTLSRNSGILSKLSSGDEIDVSSLLYHAGFQIMVKALSGPKFRLLEEVLEVIRGGVDAVNRNQHGTLHFANCVLRGLRIIFKATLHQRDFVSACNTFSTGGIVPPFASQLPSSVTTLDQFFLYRNDVVSKLAGFVGCAVNDEIAWLAVRVLHSLSQTSAFGGPGNVGHPTSSVTYVASSGASRINRLVSIIRQSSDRDVIIQAFADRLDVEDAEDDVPEPENALLETNGMLRHVDGPVSNARFSVRGAILDLLLDNLAPQVVSPSISHLLLGFDVQRSLGQSVLRNPRTDPTTNLNPLHVVVDLIQRGTGGASDRTPSLQQIFWIRHPNLAEKCYHLIYTLCADTQTSTATLQYLRDDDVLASQLRILPSAELARKELAGDEMEGIDAETVVAEADITLCRGWLLRTTALELRSLSQNAETSNLTKLLKVLYLGDTDQDNGRSSGSARMLEVAQALDSSPVDLLALPRGLPVTEADLNAFVYVDPKGCQVYDVQSLATRLSSSTGFQDREVKTLLETVVRRNRQHETYFARRHVTKAWAEIVEVSLGDDCYRLIPVGEKHVLLYDLCATVLPRLADDNTDIEMVDDLSRAILGMIAKLGARGNETAALAGPNSALSVDMLATLLKQLISVLTRPSIKQSTQGDLTNALLCFIQDVTGSAVDVRTTASGKRLAVGEISDEAPGRLSAALVMRQTGALATTFRMINEQSYDKLINLLCSMALDAVEDVWKASALAALDAILALYQLHSNNTEKIVQFMNQRNFLGSLVETVRREDPALQQLIHTYETDSLNSLYIYQQRMSFFARLCLKREGADKVLDNALIEALTDSRVLDMRPEVDATHSAFDHMLAIAERYHSVLLPALRLVATILARIGKEHADVVRRATAFVVAHQDVLLSILKDRSANITMATLEQLEGITLLCSMLAGRGDFGTSNRTGFLHFHLIALLAKYSDTSRWLARLRPVGPAQEELSAQPSVIGKKNQTAFEQKAIRVARSICHNVLSYCQKSVDGRDPTKGFVPVFALSTNIPEDISYAPLTPTLGTLIVYTSNATDDLVQALEDQKRYAAKAAQVSEGRTPAPGDLDEVLGPKASTTLEPALKNRLYAKEVRKMAVELSKDIFALLCGYSISSVPCQFQCHVG